MRITNRLVCGLWAFVYRRWLENDFYRKPDRVLAVRGWRSAQVARHDGRGQRRWMQPCFWWFK